MASVQMGGMAQRLHTIVVEFIENLSQFVYLVFLQLNSCFRTQARAYTPRQSGVTQRNAACNRPQLTVLSKFISFQIHLPPSTSCRATRSCSVQNIEGVRQKHLFSFTSSFTPDIYPASRGTSPPSPSFFFKSIFFGEKIYF
jgi:hypothetical protein